MKQFAQQHLHAITIGSSPFGEADGIITLYSREQGLLRCIAKKTRNPKNPYRNLTSLLGHGEFIVSKGKSSLFRFHEGTITHHYFSLRKQRDALDSACKMLDAVLTTQLELNPSPPLYDLLCCYLQLINTSGHPKALLASFHLKLLMHEGLIAITPTSVTPSTLPLDDHEQKALYFLAFNRSSTLFSPPPQAISDSLYTKVENLFCTLARADRVS